MYCTLDDILAMIDEEDVISYTDDVGSGVMATRVTDKAISGADALINSYLAKRYNVPVDPVPEIIVELAVDIAIYKICSRRSQAPEERRQKYDDAVKYLDKIASGKAVLPGAALVPASSSSGVVNITSGPRIFGRDSLKGF